MYSINKVLYHSITLFLFIFSDLKTIVIPTTIFGVSNALAAVRHSNSSSPPRHSSAILSRTPLVFFWVVVNLLPFAINNQKLPMSIAEDAINKPWRPMPSQRLHPSQASALMYILYIIAQLYSASIGGLWQGFFLVLLGTWYNNLGGAENSPFLRNGINSLGYACFLSGALEVALGVPLSSFPSLKLASWLGVIAAIIFTTIHTQDFRDQEGDALRRRRTLPLVLGDAKSRWLVALWMPVWGILCPLMWDIGMFTRLLEFLLAGYVGFRCVRYRSVSADKRTFMLWNLWISFLYVLPLLD
ncbi:UbiA prenyltransferase family [Xylariaceae sp. FL0255]|nr:UbiA prenyltransferase family [Xylariaceae sp. FL0255]